MPFDIHGPACDLAIVPEPPRAPMRRDIGSGEVIDEKKSSAPVLRMRVVDLNSKTKLFHRLESGPEDRIGVFNDGFETTEAPPSTTGLHFMRVMKVMNVT